MSMPMKSFFNGIPLVWYGVLDAWHSLWPKNKQEEEGITYLAVGSAVCCR